MTGTDPKPRNRDEIRADLATLKARGDGTLWNEIRPNWAYEADADRRLLSDVALLLAALDAAEARAERAEAALVGVLNDLTYWAAPHYAEAVDRIHAALSPVDASSGASR